MTSRVEDVSAVLQVFQRHWQWTEGKRSSVFRGKIFRIQFLFCFYIFTFPVCWWKQLNSPQKMFVWTQSLNSAWHSSRSQISGYLLSAIFTEVIRNAPFLIWNGLELKKRADSSDFRISADNGSTNVSWGFQALKRMEYLFDFLLKNCESYPLKRQTCRSL